VVTKRSRETIRPRHVAIIMDGNRRWAKERGLNPLAGHSYVVDHLLEELIDYAGEMSIQYLTFWAFSTENWKRSRREVEGIMKLFRRAMAVKVGKLIEKGARIKVVGDLARFPADLREGMREAERASGENTKITVVFALNYGGRDEIVRAIGRANERKEKIEVENMERYLDTAGIPDPDLIIRPGGEMRLSGFLTWQSVYSELYFTDTLMPEFGVAEFKKALEEYQERVRRFGK